MTVTPPSWELGTLPPGRRRSHSPGIGKLGLGQCLAAYLLGICIPHCPVTRNALSRTSCPSPLRPRHQLPWLLHLLGCWVWLLSFPGALLPAPGVVPLGPRLLVGALPTWSRGVCGPPLSIPWGRSSTKTSSNYPDGGGVCLSGDEGIARDLGHGDLSFSVWVWGGRAP